MTDPTRGLSPAGPVPSAAWPVQVAAMDALLAHAGLAALLGVGPDGLPAVFDTLAPKGQTGNYVTLATPSEDRADVYGRAGHTGTLLVHVWATGPGAETAAAIHRQITAALDGRWLPVAGHRLARGHVQLVTSLVDPDGRTHHRVLRYRTLTRTRAAA